MSKVLLQIGISLVGDFIGTLPTIVAMKQKCDAEGKEFWCRPHIEIGHIFDMLPKRYDVRRCADSADMTQFDEFIDLDLHKTAHHSSAMRWYMSRGYLWNAGLPTPDTDPVPEVELFPSSNPKLNRVFDFGLAPFARSLPGHERWPQERWQELVNRNPEKQFALYGAGGVDDEHYVTGSNVTAITGYSLREVAYSMSRLRHSMISVSTGLCHVSFAVGKRLVLISNQGTFSSPPTAIRVADKNSPTRLRSKRCKLA